MLGHAQGRHWSAGPEDEGLDLLEVRRGPFAELWSRSWGDSHAAVPTLKAIKALHRVEATEYSTTRMQAEEGQCEEHGLGPRAKGLELTVWGLGFRASVVKTGCRHLTNPSRR